MSELVFCVVTIVIGLVGTFAIGFIAGRGTTKGET